MKHLYLIALAGLLSVAAVSDLNQGVHLFILSGQSNMAGLDPSESFIPTVEKEFGKEHVIVVKDAQGGQPIRRWYKKWISATGEQSDIAGDLYDRLMEKVYVAVQGKEIESITFAWMQGERDAREQHGEVYADSFNGLLDQLKEDLGRDDINVVIGRLSDFDMADEKYPHWTLVRKIQVDIAEADPYGSWVDTDDLNDGLNKKGDEIKDDLHYSVKGYHLLGTRFAEQAITLIHRRSN